MAKYEVVNQSVEINGVTRRVGEVIDGSDFRPLPKEAEERNEKITDKMVEKGEVREKSELDSLLETGHVVKK
jgi:hypothetical protein